MARRKAKQSQAGKSKGWLVTQKRVEQWLGQTTQQILQQDYAGAMQTWQWTDDD